MKENNNNKNDRLSINRFRDADISKLSNNDYQDYVLANLMQKVIQALEVSIHNDRIFARTKYTIFTEFWNALEAFEKRLG